MSGEAKSLTPKQCAVTDVALDTIKVSETSLHYSVSGVGPPSGFMFLFLSSAILSRRRKRVKESVSGEERRALVTPPRPLPLYTDHRHTHQDLRHHTARPGYESSAQSLSITSTLSAHLQRFSTCCRMGQSVNWHNN